MKYQPRHPDSGPRSQILKVRASDAVKDAVTAAAKAEGVTVGHWIVTRLTASLLRRECVWCTSSHPMDGRGPIPEGEERSSGMCDAGLERALRERNIKRAEARKRGEQ